MINAEQIVTRKRLLTGKNHKQTSDFVYTNYEQITDFVKKPIDLKKFTPEEAKQNCPWFLSSDAPAKTKDEIIKNDNFTVLVVDVDKGDLELETVCEKIIKLGICAFLVYSTLRHLHADLGRRWRIVIPLVSGVNLSTWLMFQHFLIVELDGDKCSTKPTQIFYLPAICSTEKYEFHIESGNAIDPYNPVSKFVRIVKRAQLKIVKDETPIPAFIPKALNLLPGQISPIDEFNKSHPLKDYLLELGYKKFGEKYLHPKSTTGEPGVAILEGRYFSHHGCDPLGDEHPHDSFDLFVVHKCNGDRDHALKKAGEFETKDGLTITEHNQNIFNGELSANETKKSFKTLDDFAISGDQIEELKQMRVGLVYVINHLAALGQITVFHASPNGGKTLYTIYGLLKVIEGEEIKGEDVFYLNCDDNFEGSIEKLEVFRPYQIKMLMPGYNGFESEMLWDILKQMIKDGSCKGKILVLDTLTKFVDNMDHKQQKKFYNLIREFSLCQGTIIILTHQNKNVGENGFRAISGTADLQNNVDVVFGMRNLVKDEQTTTVEFYCTKGRGKVVDRLVWQYKNTVDNYREKLDSIVILDDDKSLRLSEVRRMKDSFEQNKDIIDEIMSFLEMGPMNKTPLLDGVRKFVNVPRKRVDLVLQRHSGTDIELFQYWSSEKGDKNSITYELNAKKTG